MLYASSAKKHTKIYLHQYLLLSIVIGKVVFKKNDLLFIGNKGIYLIHCIADILCNVYLFLGILFFKKSLLKRNSSLLSDENNEVANICRLTAEFAVKLLLLLAKLYHTGSYEDLIVLKP